MSARPALRAQAWPAADSVRARRERVWCPTASPAEEPSAPRDGTAPPSPLPLGRLGWATRCRSPQLRPDVGLAHPQWRGAGDLSLQSEGRGGEGSRGEGRREEGSRGELPGLRRPGASCAVPGRPASPPDASSPLSSLQRQQSRGWEWHGRQPRLQPETLSPSDDPSQKGSSCSAEGGGWPGGLARGGWPEGAGQPGRRLEAGAAWESWPELGLELGGLPGVSRGSLPICQPHPPNQGSSAGASPLSPGRRCTQELGVT